MAEGKSKQYPYRTLGFQLRSLRDKEKESISDVSGAVEIEPELLVEIESGLKLPSEDILLLLISHFGLKNNEAMKLWKLAGYNNLSDLDDSSQQEAFHPQAAMFVLPIDSRVVYTDSVQASVNDFGIVVNFQQASQQSSQPLIVSRVGMSREHAENVVEVLQRILSDLSKPKSKTKPKLNRKTDNTNKKSESKEL